MAYFTVSVTQAGAGSPGTFDFVFQRKLPLTFMVPRFAEARAV